MRERDRILIVDDEADIALILKLQLEDAGFSTLRAKDGLEALETITRERETLSLILLDIKMPWMDGLQVLERVQEMQSDIPIIMMTAHGSENIAVEAMKKGAWDYISKPFNTEELLKNVQRVIQLNKTRQDNLRLQREVEEERRKTESILQGMADVLVAVGTDGRVMLVNHRAEDIFGISREEARGVPVEEVVTADIAADRRPSLVAVRTGKEVLNVEYLLRAPQGEIPVLSSATPLCDAEGTLFGSVEILHDISDLKVLEQEKQDFVSMLSHDLKTPITAVVGSIDLVREGRLGKVNSEQREYLDAAIESCEEMVGMIDNLLDVHKFEAGKMVLSFREEDPRLLIERGLTRFRSLARREEIRLYPTFREPLFPVVVDRTKFVRLLNNLVSNSLKFTPRDGEIEVICEVADISEWRHEIPAAIYPPDSLPSAGRYLLLTVRDTGSGIPEESLATIFDRFVQAKNRRQGKTEGTGLGLAFCRKVADAHKGFIWAKSEVDKGSSFHVAFPLQAPQE